MLDTLKFLTQITPPRNYKNADSLDRVANYIYNRLSSCGLDVTFQEFQVDGKIYKNVVGSLNKHCKKTLIIGGHYDVCGDTPGADDNASAIAGLIQTAKLLSAIKDKLNFRINFVAFTLEEPPYFMTEHMGSYVYVKYLKEKKIDVIGMINYEMIGYYSTEANSQQYPWEQMEAIYPSVGNFIAIVANETSSKFLDLFDFKNIDNQLQSIEVVLPDFLSNMTASDHLNFWKFGFHAIMVTDTAMLRNPNYHKDTDTLDTLDIEKMQHAVDIVVEAVANIETK